MLTHGDFDTEKEFMEFCAWQNCMKRPNELTPGAKIPWRAWFKKRFGRTLEEAKREYLAKMDP